MLRLGAHFMILVLAASLVLLRESDRAPLREADELFTDLLARSSRPVEKFAPITLVKIDEASLKEHPWPWTPLDFALFFQAANNFQPAALATEEVLSWEESAEPRDTLSKLPQYKKILREHMLHSTKVLLGAKLGFPTDPQVVPALEPVPLLEKVSGDISAIPEFARIATQPEEDLRLANTIGFANLPGNSRQQRMVPLLLRYRGQVVPTLPLQAVILFKNLTNDDVRVEAGHRIRLGNVLEIPINDRGEMRVDFGIPLNRVGFDELMLASAQLDAKIPNRLPADALKDKLLLLARTDPGARTLCLPAGELGSPGELFAAGAATILSQSFPQQAPQWVNLAVIATAMGAAWLATRTRRWLVALWAFAGIFAYCMLAIAVMANLRISLPICLPAGLALFIAVYRPILLGKAPDA